MTSGPKRRRARRQAERELAEAWEALAAGEPERARRAARRAVDAGAVNPVFWQDYGLILDRIGDAEEARRALDHAISMAPGLREAGLRLAEIEAGRGRVGRALRLIESVLERHPDDPLATERLLELRAAQARERAAELASRPPAESAAESAVVAAVVPATAATLASVDWHQIAWDVRRTGMGLVRGAIDRDECARLASLSRAPQEGMDEGPIPLVELADRPRQMATACLGLVYAHLVDAANRWSGELDRPGELPPTLTELRAMQGERLLRREASSLRTLVTLDDTDLHAAGVRGRTWFPLEVVVVLEASAPVIVALADREHGRIRKPRILELGPGDLALVVILERLVDIGGAVGRQPVLHGRGCAGTARILELIADLQPM